MERVRPEPNSTPSVACQVYSCIEGGAFGPASDFRALLDSLQHGNDYYLLAHDFPSYLEAQVPHPARQIAPRGLPCARRLKMELLDAQPASPFSYI